MSAGLSAAREGVAEPPRAVGRLAVDKGQPWLAALLVAVAYYAGAKLGLALTFTPHPISILWPPNSILLAALLLVPWRSWWLVLAAAFPAHLLAELQGGVPPAMVLAWFVSNVSEAVIGAACVLAFARGQFTLDSLRNVAAFTAGGAFLGPFLSSFLDAGFVTLLHFGESGYWDLWRTRFFANALAALTLVPLIVTCARGGIAALKTLPPLRAVEGGLLAMMLLATGLYMFDLRAAGAGMALAPLYLPLPFLLWAALRFGPAGASISFAVIAFLMVWGAGHGKGPFSASDAAQSALLVQFFLIFIGPVLLALAAAMTERRQAEYALRRSEEQYREVVETQTDLVCRYLPDTTLTFVNSAYCRFFGRTREELIGHPLTELVPESAHGLIRDYIAKLAREKRPTMIEHQVVAADGTVRWHQWVDHAVVSADGEVTEFQGIGRDITEMKTTEATLRASDERFQLVLRATKAVIYDWDIVTDTLWWSRNGLQLFGYAEDERRDSAWWAGALHPEDREATTGRLKLAIAGGGSQWDAEYRLCRGDGTYAHVTDRGYVVRGEEGAPERMIGSLLDVSDHKRLEEANEQLIHASRLAVLGELSASIAHEINQPLGAILSNADAAEMLHGSEPVPLSELKHIIEDIRRDAVRASDVIRHMRSLMRKRELVVAPFDLNRALADLVELIGPELGRSGAAVTTAFSPLPIVEGDQVHIQQVALNLIFNAAEAMAGSEPSRRRIILATARAATGGVEVTVSDTGPGIRPEDLPQLFDSFFTTRPDGMGLGLSIARSIVEAHGGTIRAETRPGDGSTFRFILPARPRADVRAPHVGSAQGSES